MAAETNSSSTPTKPKEAWRKKTISHDELAKHNSESSCWIAIRGVVYDLTEYLIEHPGGGEIIVAVAGQDATKEFEDVGHSNFAKRLAMDYAIGILEGHDAEESKGSMYDEKVDGKGSESSGGTANPMAIVGAVVAVAAAVVGYYFFASMK